MAGMLALAAGPALADITVNLNEAETEVGASGARDRIRETNLDTYDHELERITPARHEDEDDSTERAKQTTRVQASATTLSVTSRGEAVLEAPREIGLGVAFFAFGFRSDEPVTVSFSAQIDVESPLNDGSSNAVVDFSCGCDPDDSENAEACTVEDVDLEAEDSSDYPRSASVSRSGRATNGCSLFVFVSTSLGAEQTTARGKWTVSLSVSPAPPEPDSDDFRWAGPPQGAFGDESSWDPEGPLEEGVPSFAAGVRSDTARFERLRAVRVDLAAATNPPRRAVAPLPGCSGAVTRRTGRLVVSRTQELEPFNGTWALDDLSLDQRSLEVADNGSVLVSDAALCARHAEIGAFGRRSFVVATGPAGALQSLGTLSLGVGGEGTLRVTDGGVASLEEVRIGDGSALGRLEVSDATTETGSLAVGFLSRGELLVEKSGRLESEAAYVGFMTSFPADIARTPLSKAVISNASTPDATPPATWSVESLGIRMGDVDVEVGGHLEVAGDLDIGQDGDCCGGLNVRRGTVHVGGGLHVGTYGTGYLGIEDGPVDVDGVLAVGAPGTDERGTVHVVRGLAGGSNHLVSSGLEVHNGDLVLHDDARVHTVGTARVGPQGVVDFRGLAALWRITDALVVGIGQSGGEQARVDFTNPGGRIEVGSLSGPSLIHVRSDGRVLGAGTLRADAIQIDGVYGAGLTLDGNVTMGPTAVFTSAFPLPFSAPALAPPSPSADVLGDRLFSFLVGVPQLAPPSLPADLRPTSREFRGAAVAPPPPPDPVTITGDAALDGTLELSFLGGVAPAQGGQIRVLDVGGTMRGGFANVIVRGVKNAAFEQASQNGVLTLTSLTDAEPLPVVNLKAKKTLSEKSTKSGLKVTVSRAGDVSQPLLVRYELRGSAHHALDYAAISRVIEIPARKKSAKLVIRPFHDGAAEPTETIEIALVPGDGYALGFSSRLAIALTDASRKSKRR